MSLPKSTSKTNHRSSSCLEQGKGWENAKTHILNHSSFQLSKQIAQSSEGIRIPNNRLHFFNLRYLPTNQTFHEKKKQIKNGKGCRVKESQEQTHEINETRKKNLKLCSEQGKDKENAENRKRKKPNCWRLTLSIFL